MLIFSLIAEYILMMLSSSLSVELIYLSFPTLELGYDVDVAIDVDDLFCVGSHITLKRISENIVLDIGIV
jgi:hypothetical protein